ncbi:hypothetical protein ACJJI5_17060 [Microbulbifer sp. EKSA008]|uniref:hypothetical protein n=1 Tax=unclassified Microbulbifer TaxID=2619833 RepID=UPI0040421787
MRLTKEDISLGWHTSNRRAVSPIISEPNFESFLFTDSYDEWYFFREAPKKFDAVALCNYLGISLGRADEFNFEGGCDLIAALSEYQPVAVASWNDSFSYYLVNEEPKSFSRKIQTPSRPASNS